MQKGGPKTLAYVHWCLPRHILSNWEFWISGQKARGGPEDQGLKPRDALEAGEP